MITTTTISVHIIKHILTWELDQYLNEETDCWEPGTACSDTYWKTGSAGVGNNPILLDP